MLGDAAAEAELFVTEEYITVSVGLGPHGVSESLVIAPAGGGGWGGVYQSTRVVLVQGNPSTTWRAFLNSYMMRTQPDLQALYSIGRWAAF